MKPQTTPEDAPGSPLIWPRSAAFATLDPARDIPLASCAEFECIVVQTGRSVYELIVLSGKSAEVMVRGGRFFREFHRALVAGSISDGTCVKLRTISVGGHLEVVVEGESFITSRIQAVSRHRIQIA